MVKEKNLHAVLIVPACERGRGGGHLSRSLLLLRSLRLRGRDAYLWIPEQYKDDFLERFSEFFTTLDRPCFLTQEEDLSGHFWDFIVLDRFKTSDGEFAFWSNLAPLIGIDEGGPCRDHFDFLMDLLPSLRKSKANLNAPGLLPLPKNRRPLRTTSELSEGQQHSVVNSSLKAASHQVETRLCRILISFGAEDALGLGCAAARTLSGPGTDSHEITFVAPVPPNDSIPGVKVIGKIHNLQEHLSEYHLFITHFGLGAFEAVYARIPVIIISPTAYHEKLSRNAGFYSLGLFGMGGIRRLASLASGISSREFLETLTQRGEKIARRFGLEEDQKEDLGFLVRGFNLHAPRSCPVCGEKAGGRFLARFQKESYRLCPHCGTIYLARLDVPHVEYKKEYFFDSYQKQYGKTYLEDFPNLVEMGKKRLDVITGLVISDQGLNSSESPFPHRTEGIPHSQLPDPRLLDIGCAYGPFLVAAAECGFSPAGLDPAEDAVRYVKEELGFPALQGFFPFPAQTLLEEFRAMDHSGPFDVVSLWYVIEHFKESGKALKEINRLLKVGGVLAFSTPSYSGISGRKNLHSFLEISPGDHWTIWSPRVCRKILRQYGFRVRKIVVSGHHPERFPLFGRFVAPGKKGFLYCFLLFISRLFRLGDTFEVYGVKTGEIHTP